jgi:hypothetical protein
MNRINRSVVRLAETFLPELISFLRIDVKAQTFEKYDALSRTPAKVAEVFTSLLTPFGDLVGLVNARKQIVGALDHGAMRRYLMPFGLGDMRRCVEDVLGHLNRVAQTEDTLLDDIERSKQSITDALQTASDVGTFLTTEYLIPFLKRADGVLQDFIVQMRGRFSARIVAAHEGEQLAKLYPLHEAGREIRVSVPMKNAGPGRATDVRVTCSTDGDTVVVNAMTMLLGSVPPGEFEVALNVLVMEPCASFSFYLTVEWGEIGSARREEELFQFKVAAQSADIDWSQLEYASPYSTGVAEGDAFVGRQDRVRSLAAKILRTPMEPFYVTGQKRVGKTSLAKAAAAVAAEKATNFKVRTRYILWGEVADADPTASLRRLGKAIEEFLAGELPKGSALPDSDYGGSLSDLLRVASLAESLCPDKRFVLIVDEFDEIHEQLYLSGELAAAFFANLRALSRTKNIGLILVGGENMPYVMERQGQKLNNFSRVNLSYYDRASEWDDFSLLVRKPTDGILSWHEEAVSEIYNATSGNPYFAKEVCATVFARAVAERDADISAAEVRVACEVAISTLGSNSFAHLWQDGVAKALHEREPDWLRRMRVLVALARCLRNHQAPTIANITQSKAAPTLLDSEIPAVLNDFTRRDVLREANGQYDLTLPIFRLWLVDIGTGQLVADALSEEIAGTVLEQENAALVRADEIVRLVEGWPTYCGRRIGTDEVRAWLEQVESKFQQRLLFHLLERVRFYGEPTIREKLGNFHATLRRVLPVPVRKSLNERRDDILVTYIDGPGKSGAGYAALYAEENQIQAKLVVAPESVRAAFVERTGAGGEVNAIVVVDDIAATGETLATALSAFIGGHRDILAKTKLRAFVLVATAEGEATIMTRLKEFSDLDIDIRAAEVLTPADRAFPPDQSGWESRDAFERAQALCRDLGSRIYRKHPFGVGDLGLLVVFPTTVPNNTLPILHSRSKDLTKPWKPLFPRPVN